MWKDQGCFKRPYQLQEFCQTVTAYWSSDKGRLCGRGLVFLRICRGDLLVFQSIIGHLEEHDAGSTTTKKDDMLWKPIGIHSSLLLIIYLPNPVNPGDTQTDLETLPEPERETVERMLFLSLLRLWINVPCPLEPVEVPVLQWQVRETAGPVTFSFTLQQPPLSDEWVRERPETLRDVERYCQIFNAVKTDAIFPLHV